MTLSDYFNKEINRPAGEGVGEPVKRIKYSSDYLAAPIKSNQNKKSLEKDKYQNYTINTQNIRKNEELKIKSQSEKKVNEKRLKIDDSDDDSQDILLKKKQGAQKPLLTSQNKKAQ